MATDRSGIAVSVLHTGTSYPDDLTEDRIVYHYPDIDRPGRDTAEVEAMKNAFTLNIPVFVLANVSKNDKRKNVRLGTIRAAGKLAVFSIDLDSPLPTTGSRLSSGSGAGAQ